MEVFAYDHNCPSRTYCPCLLWTICLAACGGQTNTPAPANSDTIGASTSSDVLDESISESTSETDSPLPVLTPAEPIFSDGFTIRENYHVPPTEVADKVVVTVAGQSITLGVQSIFYGTESAVDRVSIG